ncbi:hypothetical protein EB796_025289 [Bugula neritina]|uniref:Uncharacterized protein n=1 Tax=Bugula neritina TaxID=10212 RepID=A0A7J7IRF0_BUGNE|nr:hypothetical protein EB796_025289 [Bugula neritina]
MLCVSVCWQFDRENLIQTFIIKLSRFSHSIQSSPEIESVECMNEWSQMKCNTKVYYTANSDDVTGLCGHLPQVQVQHLRLIADWLPELYHHLAAFLQYYI